MTELSPAQKALAAFDECHKLCPFDCDWVEQCLAAALEAVADQVVPTWDQPSWDHELVMGNWQESDRVRRKILAIAAELRGDTIPTETNGQA